jgi:hypothetical protein
MLDRIRELPLADKKTLLAMLQSDLNLTVNTEIVVPKLDYWQYETRKCNEIAIIKRNAGQVIYTDLQIVD